MEKRVKNKGFVVFDFLLTIIPILLMIILTLNISSNLYHTSEKQMKEQTKIDKLVSISDFVIRYGAAENERNNMGEKIYYPNKISKSKLDELDLDELKDNIGLTDLYVGFEETEKQNCIYRLVSYNGKISKLFFCGD